MSGASTTTPSNNWLPREFKDKGTKSVHSKVARRLREIQVTREDQVD